MTLTTTSQITVVAPLPLFQGGGAEEEDNDDVSAVPPLEKASQPPPQEQSKENNHNTAASAPVPQPPQEPTIADLWGKDPLPVPSKEIIRAFYERAMQQAAAEEQQQNVEYPEFLSHEQAYLTKAGMLSLQDVVLPALAFTLDKHVQGRARALGWAANHALLVQTRADIYESIAQARQAVQASRTARGQVVQRQAEQAVEDAIQAAHAKHVQNKRKEAQIQAERPVWAEIQQLYQQQARLEEELKQWRALKEQFEQEQQAAKDINTQEDENAPAEQQEETPLSPLPSATALTNHLDDLAVQASRLERGLDHLVQETVQPAQRLQQELYEEYVESGVMFQGYPKQSGSEMIRILSQKDEDTDEAMPQA